MEDSEGNTQVVDDKNQCAMTTEDDGTINVGNNAIAIIEKVEQ